MGKSWVTWEKVYLEIMLMCVNLNECIYGKIPLPPLPPLLEYAPSGFEQNTLPLKTAIFGKTSAPPPYT